MTTSILSGEAHKLANNERDKEYLDVKRFHEKFGLLAFDTPGHLTDRKLRERVDCMMEELQEFNDACVAQDLAKMADALIDLVYFAKGTAVMMGLPWAELWDDVQRANMGKVRGVQIRQGHVHLVDMIKPPGWQGPRTEEILAAAGYNKEVDSRKENYRDDDVHLEANAADDIRRP
jgi:predicted HAD superfamily Cof-like phosphohydrolase